LLLVEPYGRPAVPCREIGWQIDDANSPQHITPRFTEAEVDAALAPVRARLAQLEAENEALREKLGVREGSTREAQPIA
jgi:hypothetical protein